MSTVRGSLAAAVLDGKVYALGGGQPGISLETTEIYDAHLDTFMAGALVDRSSGHCRIVNGRVLCADMFSPAQALACQVPAFNAWKVLSCCRQGHAEQALHDSGGNAGRLHLCGGWLRQPTLPGRR